MAQSSSAHPSTTATSTTATSAPDFDTRSRLLDAAGPVFAKSGFDGATVREICSAAGVNVASVGYHFGDKLGLYRQVIGGIREARQKQFPAPSSIADDPAETLAALVRTMMSRIMADDPTGWESQLFMREMQSPTPVFEELVREFFQPLFEHLLTTLAAMMPADAAKHEIEKLALSVVGQCVYYKVGAGVIEVLIPSDRRQQHFDLDSIVGHVTRVTLSAVSDSLNSNSAQSG